MGSHDDADCSSFGLPSTTGKSAEAIKTARCFCGGSRLGCAYFLISTFLVLSSTVTLSVAGRAASLNLTPFLYFLLPTFSDIDSHRGGAVKILPASAPPKFAAARIILRDQDIRALETSAAQTAQTFID